MFSWTRLVVAVLWVLSLIGVGRWARAESNPMTPQQGGMLLQEYVIYSGNDIGFRVYQPLASEPVGRLVVRMSGRWKEVEIRPAK